MPAASEGKQAGGKFGGFAAEFSSNNRADRNGAALADGFADAFGHIHVEITAGFWLKEFCHEAEAAVWRSWFQLCSYHLVVLSNLVTSQPSASSHR